MSRIAKNPIHLPTGVTVTVKGQDVAIKGGKGTLQYVVHPSVSVIHQENELRITANNQNVDADRIAGTTRALLNNMVTGVAHGFECKLELVGVGYRAQTQGKTLNLTLGFSHPVVFNIPEGIIIETPSQTEIVIKSANKHLLRAVASKIRAFRPPEPYKGKGVRYAGEKIELKETKKK